MRVISLGWGVQSWGLAAMTALGVLPPVDAAIHADTTHERRETYEFAARWTPWLEERGVRVMTVKPYRHASDVLTAKGELMIAAQTTWPDGRVSGMLHRQCTHDWKLLPVRRWLQENRGGQPVDLCIGISLDEWERMQISDVKYITHRYPLVDQLDMRRGDVMRWLMEHDLEIPKKSSCVFCPYHNNATWREIKLSGNGDWQKAVEVDRMIRHKREGYVCYLHRSRKPLESVDLRNAQDHGQLTLWDEEECSGMCFL